ncbi:MAG: reprolysin-like metallopeptidase, partial [Bacteroidota bacterium]
ITLPLPDGTVQVFEVWESSVMEPELQEKYSEIRTFSGQGVDNKSTTTRFTLSSDGLSGLISSKEETSYFSALPNGAGQYVSYDKRSIQRETETFQEIFDVDTTQLNKLLDPDIRELQNQGLVTLRTLRIAIASTVEHTNYFGSKEAAIKNIVTAVQQVNFIYERDFALSFRLVKNNDKLIFLKKDNYDNNDPKKMARINQAVLDELIGSGNYDIGHVFGTGRGGFGELSSAGMDATKGMGATGLANPVGKTFYVDYFAHELGHQLGANHSFNGTAGSCGGARWRKTAYEPGSGSTIMGYAKLCKNHNLQNDSDGYFHSISLIEINRHLDRIFRMGRGKTEETDNQYPRVKLEQSEYWIPASTPYFLTAEELDNDPGDQLTYSWEQFDLGKPLVRSLKPSTTALRYIPNMDSAITQRWPRWEKKAPPPRDMNFNVIVRDNRRRFGGLTAQKVVVHVPDGAPFSITKPTGNDTFEGGKSIEVAWRRGSTRASPISCGFLTISLSLDGGKTFSSIATDIPNGSRAKITLPNEATDEAVIMLHCPGNIFFAVSRKFTIEETPWFAQLF